MFLVRSRRYSPLANLADPARRLPYDLRRLYGLEKHYINPLVISGYIWDHYWVYKYVYVSVISLRVYSCLLVHAY